MQPVPRIIRNSISHPVETYQGIKKGGYSHKAPDGDPITTHPLHLHESKNSSRLRTGTADFRCIFLVMRSCEYSVTPDAGIKRTKTPIQLFYKLYDLPHTQGNFNPQKNPFPFNKNYLEQHTIKQ